MRRPVLAVAAALLALAASAPALAHEGSPNFLSVIRAAPQAEGLHLEVLNRDDRLALVNRTGRDVLVLGYLDEPYARIAADGTVSVNRNSEATYTNDERYGAEVPDGVDPKAPPRWKVVDRSGRFEWHDHRIHWMSRSDPPQVTDPDVRTKVFDWSVPLRVDGRPAAIAGELFWTPIDDGGGAPVGAIAGLVALVLLGGGAVLVVRRRRGARQEDASAEAREAW